MARGLVLLLMLALAGCVRASATSYVDTSAYQGQRYGRVLVMALGMPLDQTQAAEAAAVESLGAGAMASMSVLPPSIRNDEAAMGERLAAAQPDALLVIYGIESSVQTSQTPYVYNPGTTYGTANVVGNYVYYNTYTTPGYVTGGAVIEKPRGSFGAYIMDGESGKQVWQASINARGNAFADFVELAAGAASEAVEQAKSDGLVW